jgi:hypothetical protein
VAPFTFPCVGIEKAAKDYMPTGLHPERPGREGLQLSTTIVDIRDERQGFVLLLHNWALWFLALGVVLLFFSTFEALKLKFPAVFELDREIAFALIIAALLIFTTESSSKQELNRLFKQHMMTTGGQISDGVGDMQTALSHGLSQIVSMSRLSTFPLHLDSVAKSEIIKIAGLHIYKAYIEGLQAYKDGFVLDDTNWALQSAGRFYACLQQLECHDIEVRITHTGSVDVWCSEDEAKPALLLQQSLRKKHVNIKRIFVGSESLPLREDSKYCVAMDIMKKYQIDTGYVHRMEPSKTIDMTWIPGLDLIMVWDGVGVAVRGGGCKSGFHIGPTAG